MTKIKGNYELRIAVIDIGEVATYSEKTQEFISVDNHTSDEEFYSISEMLGTVYTLGCFIEEINNQEEDDFTGSYVRAFLVNVDEPEEIIGIDDFNTLYLNSGEIKQR